eukprot:TRINITY_DN2015_c0_g1_i5.p5 TRINITY_DN2015_c0_g1~~TRINITY_DN2015_c0_g1_i5.p5  ORF type:complete len:104 (+),score=7.00 TRINITY_DN2015_c0_g1_i5:1281-1592(+)
MQIREVGKIDPQLREKDWLQGFGYVGPWGEPPGAGSHQPGNRPAAPSTGVGTPLAGFGRPAYDQQPTQNWYGQGESDCLIKTQHCDGQKMVLTQCDFCPCTLR